MVLLSLWIFNYGRDLNFELLPPLNQLRTVDVDDLDEELLDEPLRRDLEVDQVDLYMDDTLLVTSGRNLGLLSAVLTKILKSLWKETSASPTLM